jgi:hypothetical protein
VPDTPREKRARQEAARLAARYQSLEHLLRGSRSGTAEDRLSRSWTATRKWMSSLNEEVFASPKELADPFADFLKQGADEITRSARSIQARYLPRPSLSTADEWAAVACCIVNAAYEILGKERPESQGRVYETLRIVERSEYVKWLRLMREVLVVVRDLNGTHTLSFGLEVLAIDVSAQIQAALDRAITGPLVAAMVSFEWATTRLGEEVAQAIGKTRCLPLIEMWGTILQWLYSGRGGFMRNVRGFISTVYAHMTRNLRAGAAAAGAQLDDGLAANVQIDRKKIQAAIDVLDALLVSTTLVTTCRVSDPQDTPDSPDSPDRPDRPERPERPERPRRPTNPADNPGGFPDGVPEGGRFDPSRPGIDGPSRTRNPRDPSRTGGYVDPADLPDGDYVYLTPANVEYVLVHQMNIPLDVAARVARGQTCRDSLTPETEAALTELGILFD